MLFEGWLEIVGVGKVKSERSRFDVLAGIPFILFVPFISYETNSYKCTV